MPEGMKELIDMMAAALPCDLSANRAQKMDECAQYDFHTMSWDGVKREIQLKVRIFAFTMERALELMGMVERAIVTAGDQRLTGNILSCAVNGGGWVTDGERHCRIAYFDVLTKDTNIKE